jgi:AsmA-like C-terminal region/AsmA family
VPQYPVDMPRLGRLRIFKALLAVLALCTLAGYGFGRWVGSPKNQQRLATQLEHAFGRRVEAGRFSIRWLPLPAIAASNVTIGEDPRFGNEYLLRAEDLDVEVRWMALLAGRLEFGAIRFVHPSLNVVRTLDGTWNVESWLPAPATAAREPSPLKAGARPIAHLERIDIEDGRINLRRGADVRPFALTDVSGRIEQISPGRWRIALAARPARATVHLQESGTLYLHGEIAGTSARLQPAELALSWSEASVADALRLLLGRDAGVRGSMQLELKAATSLSAAPLPAPAQWNFSLSALVTGLHRWDLPWRSDNPAISVHGQGNWQAATSRLEVQQLQLAAAGSRISARGEVDWAAAITPHLEIAPAEISWTDLLHGYRAFTPAVDESLSAEGTLRAHGRWDGISARELRLEGETDRVDFRVGPALLFSLEGLALATSPANATGSLSLLLDSKAGRGALPPSTAGHAETPEISVVASLAPTSLRAPQKRSGATPSDSAPPQYTIRVDGRLLHTETWLAAARALGKPLNAGWDATGGSEVHVVWQWQRGQSFPRPVGTLTAEGLSVRLSLLNQPIELADARVELSAANRHVTVVRATALGAHWQGALAWPQSSASAGAAPLWQFDLAADQLDASELDRWLGPRARTNWFAQLFSPTPTPRLIPAAPRQLHARGTLRVGRFSVSPLEAQNIQAQLELDGRVLTAQQIQAQFYGGSITGALEAKLTERPAYRFSGRLEGANLSTLAASSPALTSRLAGSLSVTVELSTSGIGREQLLDALEARGKFAAARARIEGLDLSVSAAPGEVSSASRFSALEAAFLLTRRAIELHSLLATTGTESYVGSGRVDFSRHLDVNLRAASLSPAGIPATLSVATAESGAIGRRLHIAGLLEAPRISVQEPAAASAQPGSLPLVSRRPN